MELYQAVKKRRSYYNITDKSTISDKQIQEIVADAITYSPSAFHSQSSRAVLLFGEHHKKLWSIVLETLRKIVPSERFDSTQTKIASFSAGHGTILYFEDLDTVENLQKNNPLYAENFPVWSMQSSGMFQYAVWTALASEGFGASLQHYNPLIDEAVSAEFSIPKNWKLIAQMPFGIPASEPSAISYKSIDERIIALGGNDD